MILEEGALFANRYVLGKLLGKGGFSEVWLALDNKSGLNIALKIYAPYGGLDDTGAEIFSKEFSLVFNVNHTNILTPTYFDIFENSPYLIMPFCSNGSASSLIGQASSDDMLHILHDVAAGLAYLHSQTPSIIHQDIKPDNILLNDHGDYVITDFGISTKSRSTLRKSALKGESGGGTCGYMGPERFSTDPTPVKASDIWSLGAMAYELLDGNTPYDDIGGVMQKNGAEIPEIKANVPKELKELIYSCLAKNTWDRPSASDIVKITEKMLGLRIEHDPPRWKETIQEIVNKSKSFIRNNWIWIGGVCVIAFIVILWATRPHSEEVIPDETPSGLSDERLAFLRDSLSNVILDDMNKYGGYTDSITGVTVYTAGYLTTQAITFVNDSTTFDVGKELLERIAEKKFRSSAEAAAILSYMYAIRNAGSNPDKEYLSLINPASLNGFAPDPNKATYYSDLALSLNPTCYQARFEKCMDYIGGPHRGYEARRLDELQSMFESGKENAIFFNDTVYTILFSHFEEKYKEAIYGSL